MEELIKRLERVIQTGTPDKDGMHPISAETVLEVVNELSEHSTDLASLGTDCISRQAAIDALENDKAELDKIIKGMSAMDVRLDAYVSQRNQVNYDIYAIKQLPPAEPKKGKWIKKHRHYGGFRSYTGLDSMGEQHTITVDERAEYDDLYCSECGARSADNFLNFCPNCGAKMEVDDE